MVSISPRAWSPSSCACPFCGWPTVSVSFVAGTSLVTSPELVMGPSRVASPLGVVCIAIGVSSFFASLPLGSLFLAPRSPRCCGLATKVASRALCLPLRRPRVVGARSGLDWAAHSLRVSPMASRATTRLVLAPPSCRGSTERHRPWRFMVCASVGCLRLCGLHRLSGAPTHFVVADGRVASSPSPSPS